MIKYKIGIDAKEPCRLIISCGFAGDFLNFPEPIEHVRSQIKGNELRVHVYLKSQGWRTIQKPVDDIGYIPLVVEEH